MKQVSQANQQGQIGLIVLLVMATMLTVGVGTVTQSTRDLKITRQEVEASQVFNAAEAGIESGLGYIESGGYSGGNYSDTVSVSDISVDYQIEPHTTLSTVVGENQVAYIDTGYPELNPTLNGRSLTVRWAEGINCPDAASLVVKIYNSSSGSVDTRGVAKCDRGDGFTLDNDGNFNLTLRDGDEFVRIRAVYFNTDIFVEPSNGSWNLPVLYHSITARASRASGNETKVIQLDKTLKAVPSVFDFALFSGNAIIM